MRMSKPNIDPRAMRVFNAIREAGGMPYLVGGFVRDTVMGRDPHDYDVEVYCLFSDALMACLDPFAPEMTGARFGVVEVVVEGLGIQITPPRRESKCGRGHMGFNIDLDPHMPAVEACARRDFTINAMMMNPFTGDILDFFGGIDDIRKRVLRHTSPAFAEDPARVLRGVQQASRFGFSMALETAVLCRQLYSEAAALPADTVWHEIYRWAAESVSPVNGLKILAATGWDQMFPGVAEMRGVPQSDFWHPEGDVATHTNMVVDAAKIIAIREKLPPGDRVVLMLAAWLHDIGKTVSTHVTATPAGLMVASQGHEALGAPMARAALRAMGAPSWAADQVEKLVACHMRHLAFGEGYNPRIARRLAADVTPANIHLLSLLIEADSMGRAKPGVHMDHVLRMRNAAGMQGVVSTAPKPILKGAHMLARGFKPGPDMGKVLKAAFEAQLDGAFDDEDGAAAWLTEFLD